MDALEQNSHALTIQIKFTNPPNHLPDLTQLLFQSITKDLKKINNLTPKIPPNFNMDMVRFNIFFIAVKSMIQKSIKYQKYP